MSQQPWRPYALVPFVYRWERDHLLANWGVVMGEPV